MPGGRRLQASVLLQFLLLGGTVIFSFSKNDPGEFKADRRSFLKLATLASVVSFSPGTGFAAFRTFLSPERSLSFYNTHTGDRLKVVYWIRGQYSTEALEEINHILRDHRTGEIKPIDTSLIDLLCAIHLKLEARAPFYIISGYRSPATNAFLCKRNNGVARKSLHMKGKAADIRLPGCDLSLLRRVAMGLRAGGVGYYRRSNFVHVDVGRLRYW
ncbi:MAG: DUF882 domain-containing protein [Deltaproteobacteria bacterium]|nr:DUF882 domain-containing protein [Deltaproteobacteria bacterium]MBW2307770.1 DUF882 domain-containing protein [Deltaproteobacteria bacterium]